MCFDLDSHPPIDPIAGGALDSAQLILTAADRNRFAAFRARATEPDGAGVVDPARRARPRTLLRGALAALRRARRRRARHRLLRADGRAPSRAPRGSSTCPTSSRRPGRASAPTSRPRSTRSARPMATSSPARDLHPRLLHGRTDVVPGLDPRARPGRCHGHVRHARRAVAQRCPGAGGRREPAGSGRRSWACSAALTPGITAEAVASFDAALGANGVDHRIVTYPGAPHSFFDRKAAEFADASAAAWSETLGFVGAHTPAAG